MGMPAHQTEWTAEMARALPDDGKRYEVLDGELFVSPAPRLDHQAVVLHLAVRLEAYVRTHKLGWLFVSPADIEFSPHTLVQPDLFVVPDTGKGRPRSWHEIRQLLLVVEVLSHSTARVDRTEKRTTYQRERIPDYWIVDADGRVVERWCVADDRPEVLADSLTWRPRADVPALEIDLVEFFVAALD